MRIGRLHVITDFYFQQRYSHAELAELAIGGGADTIQFRQKHGLIRHKLREARKTALICGRHRVPLIVDDHIDITMAINADGVHLGQLDFPVKEARQILGNEIIIGATANTLEQALEAQQAGASYIGFGPVFPSHSKPQPAPLRSLDDLARVCDAVRIPVIAISGITPERVRPVLEAGAYGVAVMTAITTADDPLEATAAFRQEIDSWLAH